MNFKTLVTINAVLVFLFGSTVVLYPGLMMGAYGITLLDSAPWSILAFSRLLGAVALSLGIILFSVRNIPFSVTQKSLTVGLLMANLLCLFFTFLQRLAIWSIASNTIGWVTVSFFFILSIGYGLLVMKKETSLSISNA
jgi:hypothetical protein